MRKLVTAAAAVAAATLAAGCSSASGSSGSGGSGGNAQGTLRLGFLANITHAPALVGADKGIFAKALGKNVALRVKVFEPSTEQATALLAGQRADAHAGTRPAT